ncbi:hypothetical protein KXR53_35085 [Inquilinus limosus]|uniref:hypothetical protein n=1 Tax=Inquilinus limosus TaxID=171674 RepID=UPI003F16D305
MKTILISAVAALLLGSTGAARAQTAIFETQGLPIAPHQAQLTGLADLREQAPSSPLVLGAMPASPHQLAVLAPRHAAGRQLAGAVLRQPATTRP